MVKVRVSERVRDRELWLKQRRNIVVIVVVIVFFVDVVVVVDVVDEVRVRVKRKLDVDDLNCAACFLRDEPTTSTSTSKCR